MDEMSELNITLKSIDTYIEGQRLALEKGEALDRLMKDPDFQLVIMEGYIEVEARKLFKILTTPSRAMYDLSRDEILRKLDSIKDLKEFVGTSEIPGTVKIEALNAPGNIAREEDERVNVTARAAMEIN